MRQTRAEKNYKTDEKSLLWEFLFTLRAYFNISAVQDGGMALFSLENGQRFKLSLEEVK